MKWQLWALIGLTIFLRLSFLPHAIQGDDIYYLLGAQHALIDPAHPSHAQYLFQGDLVSMQGHPHPPLNSWILSALLAIFGGVYEVRFHAVYLGLSVLAVAAMWALSVRFCSRPAVATLLFVVTPAFVINGTSLETDVPLVALWLSSMGAFFAFLDSKKMSRYWLAALAMAAASLMAYQSLVLVPILAAWLWRQREKWWKAWALLVVPPVTVVAFQLFEKLSSGSLPAAVLSGYFSTYSLQRMEAKLANAAALTGHLGWMVFPPLVALLFFRQRIVIVSALVGALVAAIVDFNLLWMVAFSTGVAILVECLLNFRNPGSDGFLRAWILIFFSAALVLFFAGSARYLLPVGAPLAILVANQIQISEWAKRLWPWAVAVQLMLLLGLCFVNYRHWQSYQRFLAAIQPQLENKRVWVNSEWGFRFYAESMGALPLLKGQAIESGDILLTSKLAYPVEVNIGGSERILLKKEVISPSLPLRLVCLECRSGYSAASFGFRPFEISGATIDEIKAELLVKVEPSKSFLTMDDPEAERHFLTGLFGLENGYRWMSGEARIALKSPLAPQPLWIEGFVGNTTSAGYLTVFVDDAKVANFALGKGSFAVSTRALKGSQVRLQVDKTSKVVGDGRDLGIVLTKIGFRAN
jgi:hypothetical protein